MPPPLPSLPLHAVRDGSGRSTLRPAVLAPPPPRRAPAERVRFDVRGFLAGFALSWAFGVVLYLGPMSTRASAGEAMARPAARAQSASASTSSPLPRALRPSGR